MINPSSSAFVSEQMMDPKPHKKTKQKQKQKNLSVFPVLSPYSSLIAKLPNSGLRCDAAPSRAQEFSRFHLSAFFPSLPLFSGRNRNTYLHTYLPTYLPTVPTYVPPYHAYCTLFGWFLLFRMKKWTLQGRNPTFHVPIILPTTTHVQHKLLVPHKLIHEQLCPLPPPKKTKNNNN